MTDTASNAEHKYLLLATVGNALIGCAGVTFYFISSSQAILLDGVFNLTFFIAGLFTLRVARLIRRGDNDDFPFGYVFFEPLVNGIKGVLVLGVTLMAFVDALDALVSGGRAIAAVPAIAYCALATIVCLALAVTIRRGAIRTASPLVKADAENWLVNGAISLIALLAFVGAFVINETSVAYLAPYVDPTLVIVVILFCISVPVRMAWRSLMELLNRAPQSDVTIAVRRTIEACTAALPVQKLFVRVVQPGRTRMVLVHVVLPREYSIDGLATLDALRAETLSQLKEDHADTIIDMVFTADPTLGAPASAISAAQV